MQFYAKIHQGVMHNRGRGVSRQARWIEAREIPLQYLKDLYGIPTTSRFHPHNVEGLAWDLDKHAWRIASNAVSHSFILDTVNYDEEDDRLFYK